MQYDDVTIDGERVGFYEIDERPGSPDANARRLGDSAPEVVSEGRWHPLSPAVDG